MCHGSRLGFEIKTTSASVKFPPSSSAIGPRWSWMCEIKPHPVFTLWIFVSSLTERPGRCSERFSELILPVDAAEETMKSKTETKNSVSGFHINTHLSNWTNRFNRRHSLRFYIKTNPCITSFLIKLGLNVKCK